MPKRAILVHGWGGGPADHWFPWLAAQLRSSGWAVVAPAMPETDAPVIADWVEVLATVTGELDEQTFFVGHSIGCQAIMRYLATQTGRTAGGCVFVAGWFLLENMEDEEEERIAAPWMRDDVDWAAVRQVAGSITVINSSNDDYNAVSENKRLFEERVNATVTILDDMGHFTAADGVLELPEALAAVQDLAARA